MEEIKDMKKLEKILAEKLDKSSDESLESSDSVKLDQLDADGVTGGANKPVIVDDAIELPEI